MRRSPLRYISREFCGFCFVTQGFFCNETKSFYRHKAIERATSSSTAKAVPLPRWGRLNTPINCNLSNSAPSLTSNYSSKQNEVGQCPTSRILHNIISLPRIHRDQRRSRPHREAFQPPQQNQPPQRMLRQRYSYRCSM